MSIPFRFRKVPPYVFDGDGRFPGLRILGRDKRMMRKRQIRRALSDFERA